MRGSDQAIRMSWRLLGGLLGGLALLAVEACGRLNPPSAESIDIYAAASTTDALTEITAAFEAANPGVVVRSNFAGSSTLARQIAAGAAADIYLSANPAWMDYLEERHLLEPDSRFDLLANTLVLVTGPAAASDEIVAIEAGGSLGATTGRIALADPLHVPAGLYARQALESLQIWEQVQARIIAAVDVRAALRLVEMGEAAWGLVYATDAAAGREAVVVRRIEPSLHEAIVYPVALCRGAAPQAHAFRTFLQSEESQRTFERYGFQMCDTTRLDRGE